jgi:MFS superfamily sulfate permease-like transporter
MLVLASVLSGVVLMVLGIARAGRIVAKVPHSIIVGFTIGIAITIAMSQIGEVLGIKASMGYAFLDKLKVVAANLGQINPYAIALGLGTFAVTKILIKVSPFIPAPLIALASTTLVAATVWSDKGLSRVIDKYGKIPTDFLVFTTPGPFPTSPGVMFDLAYFVAAIVFVSAVESLLCSRMADRLADNKGTPYNPNKELWGQGLVQIFVPLLNGFPHTGALARTATNIKVGAISPLAGVFKFALKLVLAVYLASYLELVPMACIGGILLYVSTVMVKPAEVREVFAQHRVQVGLMAYTAVAVVLTDFLTGVLSALVIWAIAMRFVGRGATEPATA